VARLKKVPSTLNARRAWLTLRKGTARPGYVVPFSRSLGVNRCWLQCHKENLTRLTTLTTNGRPVRPVLSREAMFTRALLKACEASREIGYAPREFEAMVAIDGGVRAVKRLMTGHNGGFFHSGLQRLVPNNLHLSVEHIMLDERFERLFTKDELEIARWRLDQAKTGRIPQELRARSRQRR
jgi:hypothetical protein